MYAIIQLLGNKGYQSQNLGSCSVTHEIQGHPELQEMLSEQKNYGYSCKEPALISEILAMLQTALQSLNMQTVGSTTSSSKFTPIKGI